MKARIHTQTVVAGLFILIVLSCSESEAPTPFTYTQVFTGANSKTWTVDKVLIRKIGQDDQAVSLSSCEKDDRYTFYANDERLYEVDNGRIPCEEGENQNLVSYTWAFSNANASLTMVIPHFFENYVIPFVVKKASKSEMILEIFADDKNTISYVFYFKSVSEN
jgi:hypothetical protein